MNSHQLLVASIVLVALIAQATTSFAVEVGTGKAESRSDHARITSTTIPLPSSVTKAGWYISTTQENVLKQSYNSDVIFVGLETESHQKSMSLVYDPSTKKFLADTGIAFPRKDGCLGGLFRYYDKTSGNIAYQLFPPSANNGYPVVFSASGEEVWSNKSLTIPFSSELGPTVTDGVMLFIAFLGSPDVISNNNAKGNSITYYAVNMTTGAALYDGSAQSKNVSEVRCLSGSTMCVATLIEKAGYSVIGFPAATGKVAWKVPAASGTQYYLEDGMYGDFLHILSYPSSGRIEYILDAKTGSLSPLPTSMHETSVQPYTSYITGGSYQHAFGEAYNLPSGSRLFKLQAKASERQSVSVGGTSRIINAVVSHSDNAFARQDAYFYDVTSGAALGHVKNIPGLYPETDQTLYSIGEVVVRTSYEHSNYTIIGVNKKGEGYMVGATDNEGLINGGSRFYPTASGAVVTYGSTHLYQLDSV